MKARITHEYSTLDKRMEYFVEADNVWTWFEMGKHLSREENHIYPYIPTWKPNLKIITITGKDATSLGRKISKRIITWSKKDLHR